MSQLKPSIHVIKLDPIDPSYQKRVVVDDVNDGKITRRVELKSYSVADTFGSLPSSDFSMQNYFAMGLTNGLTPRVIANGDVDSVSESFAQALSQFDNQSENVA